MYWFGTANQQPVADHHRQPVPKRAPLSPATSAAGLMGGAVQGSVGVMITSQCSKARLHSAGPHMAWCSNADSSESSSARHAYLHAGAPVKGLRRLACRLPTPEVCLDACADLLGVEVVGCFKAGGYRQAGSRLGIHTLAAGRVLKRGCTKQQVEARQRRVVLRQAGRRTRDSQAGANKHYQHPDACMHASPPTRAIARQARQHSNTHVVAHRQHSPHMLLRISVEMVQLWAARSSASSGIWAGSASAGSSSGGHSQVKTAMPCSL